MKKIFISVVMLHLAIATTFAQSAQKDTITINPTKVEFKSEKRLTKTGKEQTDYYIIIEGKEEYSTTKTTMERYKAIRRFKGTPCFILITDKKSHAQRIVIL